MEVFKKIVVFLGVLVGCCQSGIAVTDNIRPDNYLYQGQTLSYKEYGQYDYAVPSFLRATRKAIV